MPKPTTSQSILLHAMLSAAVAVIVAAALSVAQYYFANGQDLALTSSFALGTFGAVFIAIRAAVWHALITSNALPQAEKDTEGQVQGAITALDAKVEKLASSVLPFVHQHNAPVVSRAVTTPAARPPQPIVMPSVPATAPHISFGDTGMVPVVPVQ